mmetsp:Transcript_2768/g.9530  ORF Transcript_2768/g.9530 Transcript_2768/m.9530 type:complete len:228 (-) Transcript_2768:472-1155(-)
MGVHHKQKVGQLDREAPHNVLRDGGPAARPDVNLLHRRRFGVKVINEVERSGAAELVAQERVPEADDMRERGDDLPLLDDLLGALKGLPRGGHLGLAEPPERVGKSVARADPLEDLGRDLQGLAGPHPGDVLQRQERVVHVDVVRGAELVFAGHVGKNQLLGLGEVLRELLRHELRGNLRVPRLHGLGGVGVRQPPHHSIYPIPLLVHLLLLVVRVRTLARNRGRVK